MKKLIFTIAVIVALMGGTVVTFAEETAEVESEVVTEAMADTEGIEETEVAVDTEATIETEPIIETEKVDFEDYAEKFVDYIFSGAAGSSEIMDKIIEMGAQYLEAKEQGFTFEQRISQLLTPDNIMATAAAAFLVVIGIAFFIFRHTQTASSRLTMSEIARLRELYEEEVKTNGILRERVEIQSNTIDELKLSVKGLSEKSDLTKTDMSHVNALALATATMVKDVFMNSKTIDASGKNLLLHDYTKALEESEKFGEVKNENQ